MARCSSGYDPRNKGHGLTSTASCFYPDRYQIVECREDLTVEHKHPEALRNRGGHSRIQEISRVRTDCDARYFVDSPTRRSSDAEAIARRLAGLDAVTRKAKAWEAEKRRGTGPQPSPRTAPSQLSTPRTRRERCFYRWFLLFVPVCNPPISSNLPRQSASSPDHGLQPRPGWPLAHLWAGHQRRGMVGVRVAAGVPFDGDGWPAL